MGIVRRELVLEGLDCANCANKIEKIVGQLEGVNSASVNFVTKVLSIQIDKPTVRESLLEEIQAIVSKAEPQVIVRERLASNNEKQVLLLLGLDCANCATKIEKEVAAITGIVSAAVDFVGKRLIVEAKSRRQLESVFGEITRIINRLEPGVKVIIEKEKIKATIDDPTDKPKVMRLLLAASLFGFAIAFDLPGLLELTLFGLSYLFAGGDILLAAGRNILRGQVFDENFLMAIATLGAFAIQEYPEAVAVMLFFQVGEYFQGLAVNRSRRSITALMDIRPDFANVKSGNQVKTVDPGEVNVGDHIVVKPGEKVPLDGTVVQGDSMVDTSALTGESLPKEVGIGSEVFAGFINQHGLLDIAVTREFGESTVAKILDLVQNAGSRKAPTENFITKFARYYTPVVVIIALILAVVPPLVFPGETFAQWIYRALVFLVVSCPCALVISIPLGFFGGIGGASKYGILVKGSNYLEALNNVETVVFDKTGTLTRGVFKVSEITPSQGFKADELLNIAAHAEYYSNHPIAQSILKAFGKEVDKELVESYEEQAGLGIQARVGGVEVLAGNQRLLERAGIPSQAVTPLGTVVHVAINNRYAGFIVIADELKPDSAQAIQALKQVGVKRTIILTGDNAAVGAKVAEELGIDDVYAELLPDQKVAKFELIEQQKSAKAKLVFVGDGINDAPVLARADIGVAMGGLGSDAAIEAADIVIMTDEPAKIPVAIKIAKRTRSIVLQNIVFALGVKVIVLILGAGGLATMWEAVFADVGVTLIAILNSMRVMNVKPTVSQ